MTTSRWHEIWDVRPAPPPSTSILSRLLNGDGRDSGFAPFTENDWSNYVHQVAETLQLKPGESAFEVGCGAGAFLYELARLGMNVGGIDRAPNLVGLASHVMPDGQFSVCDAANLDQDLQVDAVLSMSVFQYFPSTAYALQVIARMVAKARRVVAIFDLPDIATRENAIAERVRLAGGPRAYAERYEGLDHLYFDREEVTRAMLDMGLRDVRTSTQHLANASSSQFRFNVWGTK